MKFLQNQIMAMPSVVQSTRLKISEFLRRNYHLLWALSIIQTNHYSYNFQGITSQYLTYDSHDRPTQNFSSQYHYNIKQTSDENIGNVTYRIISWLYTKFSKPLF